MAGAINSFLHEAVIYGICLSILFCKFPVKKKENPNPTHNIDAENIDEPIFFFSPEKEPPRPLVGEGHECQLSRVSGWSLHVGYPIVILNKLYRIQVLELSGCASDVCNLFGISNLPVS